DPGGLSRFTVFRIAGASSDPGAVPEGLNGRLVGPDVILSDLFRVSSSPNAAQRKPRTAFNGSSFLAVWDENGLIRGRLFSPDVKPRGDDFTIASSGARLPRVAGEPGSGHFLVVWEEGGAAVGALVHDDARVLEPVTLS